MGKIIRPRDDGEAWTAGDVAAHIDRLREVLQEASFGPELFRIFDRLERAAGKVGLFSRRMPFALRAKAEPHGGVSYIKIQPWLSGQPRHMVLSPQTANTWELHDFKVGKDSQRGDGAPALPLETFSAEHVHNDALSSIQDWKGDEFQPGISLELFVAPRLELALESPPEFRGLLWCDCRY